MVFHDYGFGRHNGQVDPHPGVRQAVDQLVFSRPDYQPFLSVHTLMAFVKQDG